MLWFSGCLLTHGWHQASQHHLAAITAGGQVWLWRNRHGYIHTRCNEWEYIASLEEKGTVLVDVAGPDLDRASSGYEANQEDQVGFRYVFSLWEKEENIDFINPYFILPGPRSLLSCSSWFWWRGFYSPGLTTPGNCM